ncbi:hypothetical protein TNCV_1702301 [Trichonephila clavipes]|nr:hypothetical protein TNCV_1702301 [Trichonephila clavipes]
MCENLEASCFVSCVEKVSFPTGLLFPCKQRKSRRKEGKSARWNEKENGDCKTELAAGTIVELKQEPALITDPNSDISFPRVILDGGLVDWWWFPCAVSCGEEDCFSFRRVYGNFPFIIPVL